MQYYRTVLIIGIIEILIGAVTLAVNVFSIITNTNTKAPNVLFFVIVASVISTLLGIGILKLKKIAYDLLLYFSSVVLLSKILILMDVINLNGALETTIPSTTKSLVSIGYHGFVLYYLMHGNIKEIFHR